MKKNRRKKNKGSQRSSQANEITTVMNFREHLKSQDPEIRDAALQHLRQADVVSVIDSKGPRAILAVADKVEDTDDGNLKVIAEVRDVPVQIDDEQSDEYADESDQQIEELRKLVEETKGPWRYIGNLQDAKKEPRFMFVSEGMPCGCELAGVPGLVFARTWKVAKQYVAWRQENKRIKLVIADVQSLRPSLCEFALMESYRHGAGRYYVVKMVDRKNVTYEIVPFDKIFHEVDGWIVRLADTELPKYIVVDDGCIRLFDNGQNLGPVLAHTREVAERFAAEIEKMWGGKLAVEESKIPVNALLDSLVEHGANCALVIRSVAEDGETKSDVIYPAKPPAE